jgi:hypothetical protein
VCCRPISPCITFRSVSPGASPRSALMRSYRTVLGPRRFALQVIRAVVDGHDAWSRGPGSPARAPAAMEFTGETDSLPEGDGFEPSVPLRWCDGSRPHPWYDVSGDATKSISRKAATRTHRLAKRWPWTLAAEADQPLGGSGRRLSAGGKGILGPSHAKRFARSKNISRKERLGALISGLTRSPVSVPAPRGSYARLFRVWPACRYGRRRGG